ncbi:putative virulence plasmid b protein [Phaeoacremonium minimum UCRPA7]|uniref:Putative virulence plasmid b protein n=1 Tax=Phaeoacremonium minimum (strain UCR-PA7) TaxID=1286976 RepID=R8BRC1_PHAM7|nr:putative virulence plasmid b protein [Phaeoacremonium minimum UCRPA7]EOO01869.1 putative virulence plasmid b protein [Phaeoacremonium minimum UCRPA7]
MSDYNAAIGRRQGKVDTDDNGLSRYMLKIETPGGIKSGNEPDLSLQYSQGTPNGIMGFSWALGGVSSIHLGAPKVVYDKVNKPPTNYDYYTPKLIMDGLDLLNIQGDYNGPNTVYTTETNNTGLTVTALGEGSGFLAQDNMGRKIEYGTTPDSRIVSADNKAREWRVKKQTDYHGNTMLYNYIMSPQPPDATKDVNTSYLASIYYCSNSVTNAPATRCVTFDYQPRPDLVTQSIEGNIITWANLLSSISIGVVVGGQLKINRSYSLTYGQSPTTGDSYLLQVVESAQGGSERVSLLPSSFTYTTPGVSPADVFKTVPANPFSAEKVVIAMIPLNMTGKALADIACMAWDQSAKTLTVKTYMADRDADAIPSISWSPSEKNVQLNMPRWDPTQKDAVMPDFLTPDLHGDGRSDLIIPFENDQGNLEFFLSQSNGVSLTAIQQNKKTPFQWNSESKFMAMDMTGTGVADVVQIYKNGSTISFRNFPGVADKSGDIGLGDAVETNTQIAFENTIEWFLLKHSGTGAVSLVRVWQEFLTEDPNQYQIKTSSFRCTDVFDSRKGFDLNNVVESLLGGPFAKGDPKWSVLSCDINGDGTQDIVLGKAEYASPNTTFTFQVSLGDGLGGFGHCSKLVKTVEAPEPKGDGNFSVTNINGGLYPSLAYIFQRKDNSNFVCLSVDGLSDGTVSNVTQYPVTTDPGFANTQVIPADLNGTGMGDWLFYSLNADTGPPTIAPVYNTAHPTDLLSSAQDSMGLMTTVSYGCLSDGAVYNSGIDWKSYTDTDPENYIVQGAPNYVVTSLKHTNNAATNSLAFEVLLQKTYRQARVNSCGRGWLGFESINTTNATDKILTVEHYFQPFPKTGIKSQIETKTLQDVLLSSQTTDYDLVKVPTNAWNIYHVNKIFDKLETGGENGRIQLTQFTTDENGNVTTKYSSDIQSGITVFESWERCTYVTIKGITGLLTGKKLSSKEANQDVSKFEDGDATLTQYTYSTDTALLQTVLRWSSDVGKFLVTTFEFDTYGNETSMSDPAGLKTTTTYDSMFNNLPIKQIEVGEGVFTTQFVAYDQASGKVVAKLETNGRLVCSRVDGFGRNVETRMKSIAPGKLTVTGKDFFSQKPFLAFSTFADQLSSADCLLDPFQEYSYNRFESAGKPYLTKNTLSYFNEEDSGQHEVVEVLDCTGQKVMQRSRQGVDPAISQQNTHVTWKYWTYDSRGNVLFESFLLPTAWNNFEPHYQPSDGTTSVFDELGRVLSQTRPSHNSSDPSFNVVSSLQYSIGGATVLENIKGPDPNINAKDVVLWSAPRSYKSINGKEYVMAATNQDGMVSEFQYDVSGNMTQGLDPQGNKETRQYNSFSQLQAIQNCYQNMVDPAKPSPKWAMTYQYDGTGQLYQTVNANGETIKFQRDSKGRPIQKIGFDGRLLVYKYDVGGEENLSSMTVYPKGLDGPMETKLSFEYDGLARLSSRRLTFMDGTEYETNFQYDWQGQTTLKSYPNGATKENQYVGALLSYSQLYYEPVSGQRETWLDGRFEYVDATGKPNNIMVGQASMQSDFLHTFTYDLQAYPLSHSLDQMQPSTGKSNPLVQEKYTYNGADQLAQNLNAMSNTTTLYNYDGKRLKNSQIGTAAAKNYAYDKAGNLSTKGDTTITYTSNGAHGVTGSSTVFDILYDRAGRMITRTTQQSVTNFNYDSFGLLASYTNSAKEETTITCGPDGKTVRRVMPGNGGSLLLVSDDYNERTQADGSTIITLKLFGAGTLLGSFSKTQAKTSPTGGQSMPTALFTDNKGNVTHRFRGSDASLLETITYDDFGSPTITTIQGGDPTFDGTSTYESKRLDEPTGLFDFGSRWYDPLVGRYTTPDDVLAVKFLARTDGLNRLAFENNDPINHTDPSGQWSLSAVLGAVLGAALVVGAIALTIATGGAAAPLAAAAAGALASGGIAGITYSFDHRNERGGKFWGGYAATVLVNAAIGAASGALGAVATPARLVSATGRLGQAAGWSLSTTAENVIGRAASVGGQVLIGATESLLQTVAHNAISNKFYGTHYGLFEGAGKAFGTGAASSLLPGIFSAKGYKGESIAQSEAYSLKAGLKGGASIAFGAGKVVAEKEGVPEKAKQWVQQREQDASNWYHQQQSQFKSLSSMVGPSGFVGSLHNELQMNQSFVNYG